ncbi:glycosyltransferase family 2 protein [Aestuariivivens marinum]|uniref:glycosyltransferase family 2 protein n=1 Tax=Aestuariivivens marinum TaxID=2913555 RepID=UPI001F571BDE|nr:glycosyltransferase family 2 protein [Aestuariivivens marinum]
MNSPLVSIIIPVYNREKIVTETLNSIIDQSYKNWECLIIDDRSTDNSVEVINAVIHEDQRFKLFIRPESSLKGANACRNIGLIKATGDYVIFFDSDDLMTPNHLDVKVSALKMGTFDFVITETRCFNNEHLNKAREKQYMFNSNDISALNYITHKINWLTRDVCIKSKVAKSIRFNENLHSGQEYNYFCKLVLKTTHATFIKEIVTLEHYHDNSIRGLLRKNRIKQSQGYLSSYWYTYLEIKNEAPKKAKAFLIYRCYRFLGQLSSRNRLFEKSIRKAILKEFGAKGLYYIFRLTLKRIV